MSSALGPAGREAAIRAISSEVLDLLVVGAGATGTGTALDAASRGLRVGLIEKGDIASGTSSKSSQLVHGGLRYLQQGNVALVRESLRERKLLLSTLAPHLVRPLPFILPLTHRVWERMYVGAGLLAYDVIGGAGALPRHRHLSKRSAMARFPDLRPDALVGALQYYDAQMDDARLAVAIARTAAREGALVAPYTSLVGRLTDESQDVHRVVVRDELSGEEYVVSAHAVALCVGVWAPEVSSVFTETDNAVGIIRSKGVHLRLPRSAIDGDVALIVPTGKSVLFVLPSPTHWLVGTTDTEWSGDPDAVEPNQEDVEYLLGLLNRVVRRPVTVDDVTYAFAGLRPLVRDQSVGGDTAKVTREHRIVRVAPGVLAIVGGKWTTYRVMARDVVDTVLAEAGLPERPCRTQSIPLIGSAGEVEAGIEALAVQDPRLAEPLADAPGFRRADVAYACLSEGACLLPDVIDRRLRLGLRLDAVPETTVRDVAEVMGEVLGWDASRVDREIADYSASHVPL
jgi:glycerol-3-phosphate dehydrogenase